VLQSSFYWCTLLPLALVAVFGGAILAQPLLVGVARLAPSALITISAEALAILCVLSILGGPAAMSGGITRRAWWFWPVCSALLSGLAGGAAFAGLFFAFRTLHPYPGTASGSAGGEVALHAMILATLGPPAVLLVFGLTSNLYVGLLSQELREDVREWWASLNGWMGILAVTWLTVFGITLFGPAVVAWATQEGHFWVNTLLSSGWVGTTVAGLLAGRSPRTGTVRGNPWLDWLAVVAPYVFLAGLLTALAVLLQVCLGGCVYMLPMYFTDFCHAGDNDWNPIHKWVYTVFEGQDLPTKQCLTAGVTQVLLAVLSALVSALAAWRVNVNVFCLRGLYADRLVRCYLGASRPKEADVTERGRGAPINSAGPHRRPNEITGFDLRDDFALTHLCVSEPLETPPGSGGSDPKPSYPFPPSDPERPYPGPYLLINTALNLVQGDELAWQERKAQSFILSPAFCGSQDTGYQPTGAFASDHPLLLGDALSVSGAAVSPNMGYHSSPAVAALLTVFNVRLGAWVGNPCHPDRWRQGSPKFGMHLFWELFSQTDARSKFVYLSDGGHFDNLGVYELVRRRCRYIIVSDASADSTLNFFDLADVIRKCRVDFGIRIEIDTAPLRRPAAGGPSMWHCAVGLIRYDDLDPTALPGLFVYLKATLTGDEPTDVKEYAARFPTFPHQTTVDQFFTESQFESYRALGYHIADTVFRQALKGAGPLHQVGDVFEAVRQRWLPPPAEAGRSVHDAVEGYARLQDEWARDPAAIGREVYDDLPAADRPGAHRVAQMLRLMESAWLGMHLDGSTDHPVNRGWLTVFQRWSATPPFQRYWPALRGEFSRDFVQFCERELHLPNIRVCIEKVTRDQAEETRLDKPFDILDREFREEWPELPSTPLRQWLQAGGGAENRRGLLIWVRDKAKFPGPRVVAGFVLARQPQPGEKPGEWELRAWLRAPFRDQGIGRRAMQQVIRDEMLKEATVLRAVQPCHPPVSPDERPADSPWLSFYTVLGFRPSDDGRAPAAGEIVYTLKLPADRPAGPSDVATDGRSC
jgi:hypothetical protein